MRGGGSGAGALLGGDTILRRALFADLALTFFGFAAGGFGRLLRGAACELFFGSLTILFLLALALCFIALAG
jgi:hypothetical protein